MRYFEQDTFFAGVGLGLLIGVVVTLIVMTIAGVI
jgi:hypothetical protein